MNVSKFRWLSILVAVSLILLGNRDGRTAEKTTEKNGAKTSEQKDWVPAVAPNKYWKRYLIMPWQHYTNVLNDWKSYESLNLRSFHIDHISRPKKKLGLDKNWPFYLGHACGKGILYLKDKDAVKKKKGLLKRPYSLADPATIKKLKSILIPRIKFMKGGTAVAYAFDDEISLGSFCTPADVDVSPHSIAGYRKWLKKQYGGDIKKLNQQYGTKWKKFGEAYPAGYDQVRRQVNGKSLGRINLSRWCDFRSYMDTQFSDCLAELVRTCNSIDPTVPAGFVGGQMPSVWGGYNYAKLRKSIQWIEAYDFGASNEILRSFWSQDRPRVQTWFGGGTTNIKSGSWSFWYFFCHGNRAAIIWPSNMFKKKDGKRQLSDGFKALKETFTEVQGQVGESFLDGTFAHDPIAIYYSHSSIQVNWVMDAHVHGGTWPNRLNSMDNALSTSGHNRVSWIKTLEDIGYQGKFVAAEDVADGILLKDKYKVLVLPRILCISDKEAAAIRAFSEAGGHVIADQVCGVFDEHGKARKGQGVLDSLFGIRHDLTKGLFSGEVLTEVNGEKGYSRVTKKNLEHQNAGFHSGMAICERGLSLDGGKSGYTDSKTGAVADVRKGRASYLNISPMNYSFVRDKPEGTEWRKLVGGLLAEAGLKPRCRVTIDDKDVEHSIETIFWKHGESTTICVLANYFHRATISSFSVDTSSIKAGKITLNFEKAVQHLKNVRTGKDLGSGKCFTLEFTPWEALVLSHK